MSIHNYLNSKEEILEGGCAENGCNREGYAYIVSESNTTTDNETVCKRHFKDRHRVGEIERAEEVFTVEEL